MFKPFETNVRSGPNKLVTTLAIRLLLLKPMPGIVPYKYWRSPSAFYVSSEEAEGIWNTIDVGLQRNRLTNFFELIIDLDLRGCSL
jgi:hypothetical protein